MTPIFPPRSFAHVAPPRVGRVPPGRVLLWAALLVAIACPCAAAKPNFTVQPPPAWVQPVAPPPADAGKDEAEEGVSCLLDDRQVRVTAAGSQSYFHVVRRVMTAAAVQEVSQLQLDFEPSYQNLVIHHVSVVRAGQVVNALRPSEVRVIQRENELDEQLFNGTLSALVVLNDVRPGDVIDYAYSVNGDNPVLAGRFADAYTLAHSDRVGLLRVRLLWPVARRLFVRPRQIALQPAVSQAGEEVEYIWERHDAPAFEMEDSTPNWFDPTPLVQLSEFETWGDVARWAAPLYSVKGLSPALKAQVEEWRGLPDAEARLLAARRFVQDEVRYMGIELGPYSHTPTQPSKVFERRFGDCKDKSLLLIAMLNELGVQARPALVNTDARRALDDWQPSPYSFDHVIVRAELGGRTYWIDPTISYQRGTLAHAHAPEYERALVVAPETQTLTEIPLTTPDAPMTSVHEVYDVPSFDSPVRFTVETTFRGPDADSMRYRLAGESRVDLGKDYLNYYADREPTIQAEGTPEITDDERANVITVTERYTIPGFWKDSKHDFLAQTFGGALSKPDVSRRSSPLGVSFPFYVEQLTEIRLPHMQRVKTWEQTVENEAMRFDARADADGRVVRLSYKLLTKRDAVAAGDVTEHLAALDRASDLAGYELRQGPPLAAGSFINPVLGLFYLLILGVVALLIIYGWLRQRRYRARAEETVFSRSLPGALPETAIRLREETEIGNYVAAFDCPGCGRRTCGVASHQGLVYDERRLVVVHVECERCRRTQDFYFALTV